MLRAFFLSTCLVVVPLSAGVASAQSDDPQTTAAARALFEEGIAHADAERWDEAADRFQRALSLRWAAPIAFNLARAERNRGHLIAASEQFQTLVGNEDVPDEIRAASATELESVRAAFAYLQVRGNVAGHSLVLDGDVMEAALHGVRIPVDPGTHVAQLVFQGEVVDSQEVTLEEGGFEEIILQTTVDAQTIENVTAENEAPDVSPEAVAEVAAEEGTTLPSESEQAAQNALPSEDEGSNTGLIVGVTVGVVAVVAIVVVAVLASGGSGQPDTDIGTFFIGGEAQ